MNLVSLDCTKQGVCGSGRQTRVSTCLNGNGEARARLASAVAGLEAAAPKVALMLEAADEELLASMAFPREDQAKLSSTNPLERLNKEIARRSNVVGICPNDASIVRLAGALLLEQNDEWLDEPRHPAPRAPEVVLLTT